MPYEPGVGFFIRFEDLDPSANNQCIFYTQKGRRCLWSNQPSDNDLAITLRQKIYSAPSGEVSLDQLQTYILSNCCRSGNARHRDRIRDIGLLIPLAKRWLREIQETDVPLFTNSDTNSISRDGGSALSIFENTIAQREDSKAALENTTCDISSDQLSVKALLITDASQSASSSNLPSYTSPISGIPELKNESFEQLARYHLRSLDAIITRSSSSACVELEPELFLSEFRPHVVEPGPDSSVSHKILENLAGRDTETGSLYIFDRASSPGHVKIGWTAGSISIRLTDIATCGYRPCLLFSVTDVPHAQRAETLVHHELIREWRRERMCKAPWCRKSHQEWFEVAKEKAQEVVKDWTNFMKKAQPYNPQGCLQAQWAEIVRMMHKNGELVTAKKLLNHYESMSEMATYLDRQPDACPAVKIEEAESIAAQNVSIDHSPQPPAEILPPSIATFEPDLSLSVSARRTKRTPVSRKPLGGNTVAEKNQSPEPTEPSGSEFLLSASFLTQFEPISTTSSMLKTKSHDSINPLTTTMSAISNSEVVNDSASTATASKEVKDTFSMYYFSASKPATTLERPASRASEAYTSVTGDTKDIVAMEDKPQKGDISIETQPQPPSCVTSESSESQVSEISTKTASQDAFKKQIAAPADWSVAQISELILSLNIDEQEELAEWMNGIVECRRRDSEEAEISQLLHLLSISEQEELDEWLTSLITPARSTDEHEYLVGIASTLEPKEQEELADWLDEITQQTKTELDSQCDGTSDEEEDTSAEDSWDADETLVEDESMQPLEKEAFRAAEKLGQEILAVSTNANLEKPGVMKTLEAEVTPAIQVVA